MFTIGDPSFTEMAVAAVIAFLFAYGFSWALDKWLLRRLLADRIAGIALGGVAAFVTLMAAGTALLTSRIHVFGNSSAIVVPPIQFVLTFLGGTFAASALRMVVYAREYEKGEDQLVFDPDYDDLSRYDDEVNDWDEKNRGRSYLRRHWVGHLPLPLSYWVNGALLSALVLGIAEYLAYRMRNDWHSLRGMAAVALGYLIVSTLVWLWSSVGIWRSAYWHRRRGGAAGWGFAARALVLLGAVLTVFRSGDIALQAAEFGNLARGKDSIGEIADMKVSPDGRELILRGNIAVGAADRFDTVLAAAPQAKTLVLSSPGGRIFEAERIAEAVRKRGLDTRVDDACMSACTDILLAGRDRSAPARARIGFHQPDFPGLSDAERYRATMAMHDRYVAAGVKEAFVWQAMQPPPQSMWFPTADELVDANVLTTREAVVRASASGRAPGGETLADKSLRNDLAVTAAKLNAGTPRQVDRLTTLEHVSVAGFTMTQVYRMNIGRVEFAGSRARMQAGLRRLVCSDRASAEAVADGARFAFLYKDRAGRPMLDYTVTSCAA
ncbi:MAG: hypothetical protein JO013_11505 [Alphaproteobacteria bacterium]|nr:hypothetical protein [Alphaproteobacteria bacterium]